MYTCISSIGEAVKQAYLLLNFKMTKCKTPAHFLNYRPCISRQSSIPMKTPNCYPLDSFLVCAQLSPQTFSIAAMSNNKSLGIQPKGPG